MLLDVIVLSFIIAFFRGGRIKEIPKFNKLFFLGTSIVLQIGSAFLGAWGNLLVAVAYLFTLAFFYFNSEFEDIRIFLVGWFLNALAIWSNWGRMPVDLKQAMKTPWADQLGHDFKHSIISEFTHLPFLGDIIYIPFPFPRVISIGDIFIALGAFFLVQRIMNKPISLIQLREGKKYEAK